MRGVTFVAAQSRETSVLQATPILLGNLPCDEAAGLATGPRPNIWVHSGSTDRSDKVESLTGKGQVTTCQVMTVISHKDDPPVEAEFSQA